MAGSQISIVYAEQANSVPRATPAGEHELGTEHDDEDQSMLWKWEARDLRTLPKAYAVAGKALKKRLDQVRYLRSTKQTRLPCLFRPSNCNILQSPDDLVQLSSLYLQGQKELKLQAAALDALQATGTGKGVKKRQHDALQRLAKFPKLTAGDAPGRADMAEPPCATMRSASSTPTNRRPAPLAQARCKPALPRDRSAFMLSDACAQLSHPWFTVGQMVADCGSRHHAAPHPFIRMTTPVVPPVVVQQVDQQQRAEERAEKQAEKDAEKRAARVQKARPGPSRSLSHPLVQMSRTAHGDKLDDPDLHSYRRQRRTREN